MESVAAFVWNGWQLCRGISGRIHLESVAALPWNTHSFVTIKAPEGMPSPSFPGYLDVLLFFGQRDLFEQEYIGMSVYRILQTLGMSPTDGRSYEYFRRDMDRAFYLGIE